MIYKKILFIFFLADDRVVFVDDTRKKNSDYRKVLSFHFFYLWMETNTLCTLTQMQHAMSIICVRSADVYIIYKCHDYFLLIILFVASYKIWWPFSLSWLLCTNVGINNKNIWSHLIFHPFDIINFTMEIIFHPPDASILQYDYVCFLFLWDFRRIISLPCALTHKMYLIHLWRGRCSLHNPPNKKKNNTAHWLCHAFIEGNIEKLRKAHTENDE